MLRNIFTFIAAVGLPLICIAEPAQEGTLVPLNVRSPVITESSNKVWNSPPVEIVDSSFLRLHFKDIQLQGSGTGRVTVLDRNLQPLAQWTFQEFAAGTQKWTQLLPGSFAMVQVIRETDETVRLEFEISEVARESHGGRVLNRQDPLHIRDRDLREYAADRGIMSTANSVAKLSFPSGTRLATCTGFMVTPKLLLTNHHCVSSAETCLGTVAVFGYQKDANGDVMPTTQYDCLAVVATNKDLDYSLLQLDGEPGHKAAWGVLQIDPAGHVSQEQKLYLVQHPFGEPKRVAKDNCKVSTQKAPATSASLESDFGHICDTENGSSGSPLLNLSNRVVGLHHYGFDDKSTRWARENRAVHIAPILSEIRGYMR